jgi:hypothetical protein
MEMRKKKAGIHWVGGWVGPRGVPDAVVGRKNSSPYKE